MLSPSKCSSEEVSGGTQAPSFAAFEVAVVILPFEDNLGDPFLGLWEDSLVCNCFEDTFVEAEVRWDRFGEGETLGELNLESQVLVFEEKSVDLCGLV